MNTLSRIRGVLLDMDGVLYRGERPTPGAPEFFQFLRSSGIRYALITNNSTRTSSQYVDKLRRMGIVVDVDDVQTTGEATADYLVANAMAGARGYVIGHEGLREPLAQAGFTLTDEQPAWVVVGLDCDFTFAKLSVACQVIRGGAGFIAANTDATLPMEEAIWPGSGALVAAVETCSGVKPTVIGKPEPTMLGTAMARLRMTPDEVAMVGDRLETDVIAGRRAGVTTILVLTGVTSREDLDSSWWQPDFVFENLVELRAAMEHAAGSGV